MTHGTGPELAALALYALGGGERVIDTEDVAIKVQELAPGRFAWRKYPNQINLELVRVALSDARKPENGSLVAGKGRTGWSLTAAGQRWAENNAPRFLEADLTTERAERSAGSIDERRWRRERTRLLATDAWQQWSVGGDPTVMTREATHDLFRIDRYVVGRAREIKINRLRKLFGDDEEIAPFIEAAASTVLKEE